MALKPDDARNRLRKAQIIRAAGDLVINDDPAGAITLTDRFLAQTSRRDVGGGTLGVCDPKAIDHQWSVEFPSPSNDVMFTVPHAPALTEDACRTFR